VVGKQQRTGRCGGGGAGRPGTSPPGPRPESRRASRPGEPDPDRLPDRIWTVPNALSIARLLGVPVFLWLVLVPHADGWAVILLIAAAASDWLDGKLARALHQESRLGQVLDPTADRLYIGGHAHRAGHPGHHPLVAGGRAGRPGTRARRGPAPAAGPRLGAAPGQFRGARPRRCACSTRSRCCCWAPTPATPRWWPRWSAGRSWPGAPRCTGWRPGCTWSRPGGSRPLRPPPQAGRRRREAWRRRAAGNRPARWPNRNNRMANQGSDVGQPQAARHDGVTPPIRRPAWARGPREAGPDEVEGGPPPVKAVVMAGGERAPGCAR